jgi:hypothetical protein
MEENISNSLQRYYNNRIEINEKQKKYFRTVYYYKNRQKLLDYQRIRRQEVHGLYPRINLNFPISKNYIIKPHEVIIEKNIKVYF